MIRPNYFHGALTDIGIDFFCGVPDSLLKDFTAYITDNVPHERHVISANEGNAIGLAAGHYLATGKPALVYLQNAGFGNVVNPLMSLGDPEIYGIPMLLIVGWRGEPGREDAVQHAKEGRIMEELFGVLELPYEVLPDSIEGAKISLDKAKRVMAEKNTPYALLVRGGTFEKHQLESKDSGPYELSREEALGIIIDSLSGKDIVISTTGKVSRELYEYRDKRGDGHDKDFLNIGAMGHTSSVALGIAMEKPGRNVYCVDGDGSVLMHMGVLAVIGERAPKNFRHMVLNNGAHESVGGQPTAAFTADLAAVAKACGYKDAVMADSKNKLVEQLKTLRRINGPTFLEVRVNVTSRKDLSRPAQTPSSRKESFMNFLDN